MYPLLRLFCRRMNTRYRIGGPPGLAEEWNGISRNVAVTTARTRCALEGLPDDDSETASWYLPCPEVRLLVFAELPRCGISNQEACGFGNTVIFTLIELEELRVATSIRKSPRRRCMHIDVVRMLEFRVFVSCRRMELDCLLFSLLERTLPEILQPPVGAALPRYNRM